MTGFSKTYVQDLRPEASGKKTSWKMLVGGFYNIQAWLSLIVAGIRKLGEVWSYYNDWAGVKGGIGYNIAEYQQLIGYQLDSVDMMISSEKLEIGGVKNHEKVFEDILKIAGSVRNQGVSVKQAVDDMVDGVIKGSEKLIKYGIQLKNPKDRESVAYALQQRAALASEKKITSVVEAANGLWTSLKLMFGLMTDQITNIYLGTDTHLTIWEKTQKNLIDFWGFAKKFWNHIPMVYWLKKIYHFVKNVGVNTVFDMAQWIKSILPDWVSNYVVDVIELAGTFVGDFIVESNNFLEKSKQQRIAAINELSLLHIEETELMWEQFWLSHIDEAATTGGVEDILKFRQFMQRVPDGIIKHGYKPEPKTYSFKKEDIELIEHTPAVSVINYTVVNFEKKTPKEIVADKKIATELLEIYKIKTPKQQKYSLALKYATATIDKNFPMTGQPWLADTKLDEINIKIYNLESNEKIVSKEVEIKEEIETPTQELDALLSPTKKSVLDTVEWLPDLPWIQTFSPEEKLQQEKRMIRAEEKKKTEEEILEKEHRAQMMLITIGDMQEEHIANSSSLQMEWLYDFVAIRPPSNGKDPTLGVLVYSLEQLETASYMVSGDFVWDKAAWKQYLKGMLLPLFFKSLFYSQVEAVKGIGECVKQNYAQAAKHFTAAGAYTTFASAAGLLMFSDVLDVNNTTEKIEKKTREIYELSKPAIERVNLKKEKTIGNLIVNSLDMHIGEEELIFIPAAEDIKSRKIKNGNKSVSLDVAQVTDTFLDEMVEHNKKNKYNSKTYFLEA